MDLSSNVLRLTRSGEWLWHGGRPGPGTGTGTGTGSRVVKGRRKEEGGVEANRCLWGVQQQQQLLRSSGLSRKMVTVVHVYIQRVWSA